ncbi:aminodeoxychorismate/anthranilate synthase component II [Roseivirga sp. E12]|uniref:anthranilate synthase component II n=1 Tax=Roseivirga sp. E12 TaxID=2819237 RepID=UPI001ABC30F3|nr:aminodeoxychorismate/anthranilate synthase component II [Roseivirga sp. E12]MBO3698943.1 aminodeoxychorismate/anthranilate synthase component II [Roseivirga sp. E12]
MILLLDNYDSFTYNLVDYFGQLGIESKVFRNDFPIEEIKHFDYSGIVLSPGPENPSLAGNLLHVVNHYIGKCPMLGICLGHQAIAEFLGGKLAKADYPMHGKISKLVTRGSEAFKDLPTQFEVVRYHSLLVEELPDVLNPTAYTESGELMAFESDEDLMVWGLQFHPEAILTQYGLEMLRNWVTFYNIV